MRAFKNTTLVLPGGMVVIPVGIVSANAEATKVDRAVKAGEEYHEIRQIEVDGVTQERIDYDAIVWGARNGDGTFSAIDRATLDKERAAAKLTTLEILEFVEEKALDPMAVKGAYWLQPQSKFPMVAYAMRLLYDALKAERKMGVVKVCLRDRQARGVIIAHPTGALALITLHWAEQLRTPDDEVLAPTMVKPQAAEKARARELIKALTTDGELLDSMRDDLIVAVETMLDKAVRGAIAVGPSEQQVQRAVDIGKAIEETLAGLAKASKSKRPRKAVKA